MKHLERLEKRPLQSIISDAKSGKYIIPTFQREFDWGPRDINELIRSIFEDYYIGTLLFWKVSQENKSSLKYEDIYGFKGSGNPDYFVLDGQQRLSAIYYALCSPDKNFPHKKSKCYFFVDIEKLLNSDFENAFSYQWHSKKVESLLKNQKEQFEHHIFPLKILGDNDIYLWTKWIDGYRDYWAGKGSQNYVSIREELYKIFKEILQDYEISYVELDKSLDMSKVCDIFTKINSSGVDLSIFDILNAAFLPKDIELKEEWRKITSPFIRSIPDEKKMKVYLLQTISVLKQKYCSPKYLYYLIPGTKKKSKVGTQNVEEVLIKSKKEFMDIWDYSIRNVEQSIKRIMNQREFGAISPKFMPYVTIIPAFTVIDIESKIKEYTDIGGNAIKLSKWYWASVFTQNYSSSVESQTTSDFLAMRKWFKNNLDAPEVIARAQKEIKDMDLKKEVVQGSAIYNAIFNLMIINGAKDLVKFQLPENSSLDDHHIVPHSWGIEKRLGNRINTILNRIPISDDTNRNVLRAQLPNVYLKEIFDSATDKEQVYEMLESHFISRKIVNILLKNPFTEKDFEEYIEAREKLIKERMLSLVK
jgi:hypothetical protein